jgi:predicted AAA+ superfamily ATPase
MRFSTPPQLLPHIKIAVDEDRKPGQFWLTGFQQFQVMKNNSESLAGRVGILSLLGLSRWELIGQGRGRPAFLPDSRLFKKLDGEPLTPQELYRFIWLGSFRPWLWTTA